MKKSLRDLILNPLCKSCNQILLTQESIEKGICADCRKINQK